MGTCSKLVFVPTAAAPRRAPSAVVGVGRYTHAHALTVDRHHATFNAFRLRTSRVVRLVCLNFELSPMHEGQCPLLLPLHLHGMWQDVALMHQINPLHRQIAGSVLLGRVPEGALDYRKAQSDVQKIELCHTVQAIVNQPRHAAHSTAATSACDGRQGMHHLPGTRPRTDPVWVRLPRRRGAGTRGMPHRGSNARREGWQLLRMADVRNMQAGFHRRDEAWAAAREVARCAESA